MNTHIPTPPDRHNRILCERINTICRHSVLIPLPAQQRAQLEAVRLKTVAELQRMMGVTA